MYRLEDYEFKIAETGEEFCQIHQLNYQTFVQEIPQHSDTGTGALVDKFHEKNTYIICVKGGQLVGMLCYHDEAPFSAASRMNDPSILDRPNLRLLEVRLMTVVPEERNGLVLPGLLWALHLHALKNGYTHYLISSISTQRKLHRTLGFELLGPDIGPPEASYAAMMAPVEKVDQTMGRYMSWLELRYQPAGSSSQTQDAV